jgi:hypothetical protein
MMTLTRFADVITLRPMRTADPLAARIERFVGLEPIDITAIIHLLRSQR